MASSRLRQTPEGISSQPSRLDLRFGVARKSLVVGYLLWGFLGPFGGHRAYLRDYGMAIIYFFTGGLFSIGWFIDAFTLPGKVDRWNEQARLLAGVAPARVVSKRGYRRVT